MSYTHPEPHILVFPYPAQGHMLPILDLTHQLALAGLAITVVITPKNLHVLSPLLLVHPSKITPLLLPFPPHPTLPAGIENVKHLGNAGNVPIMTALRKLHHPVLKWFRSHDNPPVALISDFFLGWTTHLAAELRIPRIGFFASGAFAVSVIDYVWNNAETLLALDEVTFGDLPGAPVFKNEHFPSLVRKYKKSDPVMESTRDDMLANGFSWAYVFNTFESLESKYLEHFKQKSGPDRVFGVGPLNSVSLDSSRRGRSDTESSPSENVLRWLEGCPDGSVLYVCFGSQKVLVKEQAEALAHGLEESRIRFVWVMKSGATRHLPEGFEERVAGRGVTITGWAPQVAILNHRAVGGFLSHCGWNSVLEGLTGGVVILAWPMEADQFVDARLLVEELGVGVRVCEGADSVPETSELSRAISEAMREGGMEKIRAKELKEEAVAAISEGGSSWREIRRFVEQLRHLQARTDSFKSTGTVQSQDFLFVYGVQISVSMYQQEKNHTCRS